MTNPNLYTRCKVCRHESRLRIDWLISSGVPITTIAARFDGLKPDSITRHAKAHVDEDFKRSVRLGPFASEAELRRMCAQEGKSVLEQLNSLYAIGASRLLANYETAQDEGVSSLLRRLTAMLELKAKLTKELVPVGGSTTINNTLIQMDPQWLATQGRILAVLRDFPEARAAVAKCLRAEVERKQQDPKLIEHAPAMRLEDAEIVDDDILARALA